MRRRHLSVLLVVSALLAASSAHCATPAPADPAVARLHDLDVAQEKYVDKSPAFSADARQTAHTLIASLRTTAGAMSAPQFVAAVMSIAAIADNGHDTVLLGDGAWTPSLRLPIRMIWFPDAIVVARAAPEYADLLGAHVMSIESLTPDQLLERLRPLQGGTDTYRRWDITWVFHSAEMLNALGIAASPDRLTMLFRLPDGRTVQRVVTGRPVADLPPGQHPKLYWLPGPWPGEAERGWRTAIDAGHAPLYLQQGDQLFRMADLPDLDTLYVQFRSNFDEGQAKIGPFVRAVGDRLRSNPPKNIIVDLRFDTGGDNTTNRSLMRKIAQSVPGRIYLFVGNYTFSAGIASAAALAHDGGAKVTIAGSEIGDRTYWWSENGDKVCLPDSKVCFTIHTGYWDIVNGCKGNRACYSDQFDLRVPTLDPAIKAPLLSADWLNNRDPALEAVTAELKQRL